MKLLVSALLLAAASVALAQQDNGQRTVAPADGAALTLQQKGALEVQARAQIQAMLDRQNQTGCPVVFKGATLSDRNRAGVFPVASGDSLPTPALNLRFENASGKSIRSVEVSVRVTGKADKYQLDASTFTFQLTFSGTDAVDRAAEQLRQIPLPRPMYPYGMSQVSLNQVFFTDGSSWTAAGHSNCSFSGPGGAERVEAK